MKIEDFSEGVISFLYGAMIGVCFVLGLFSTYWLAGTLFRSINTWDIYMYFKAVPMAIVALLCYALGITLWETSIGKGSNGG